MIIGRTNYAGGVTLKTRVSLDEKAILARCSGFDPFDGSLVPEKLISRLSTSGALTATITEQTPFPFLDTTGAVRLVARDKDEAMREFTGTAWGSAGASCPIVPESLPVKMGEQIIFSTDGPNARLMVYEPESASTKLRPLSFKGPGDYETENKPVVTASATPAVRLFDCEDGNAWASPGTGCTENNAGTDVAVLTLDSTATASTMCFTKSLGAGLSLVGKVFLILDISQVGDPQSYTTSGLFANDEGMYPSGYTISLWEETDCTGLIGSYHIPKLATPGRVYRVALNLGTRDETVKGVSIDTASFFTAPAGSATYSLSIYSEDFTNNWTHKSAMLCPAVQWKKSPWAVKLAALNSTGELVDVGLGASIIADGGFEASGWTYAAGSNQEARNAKSGSYCLQLDNNGEYATSTAFAVSGGRSYQIEHYYRTETATAWRVTVTPDSGSPQVYDYNESTFLAYRRKLENWTAPAGATSATVKIEAVGDNSNFRVDDVAVYPTNQATQGAAYILESFNSDPANPDRSPAYPKVRWAYCFAGKDKLSVDLWKLMVSNGSDYSSPDTFADPFRTYSLALTLPAGPILTVASAPTAAGTGYTVGDVLTVAGGSGGKVRVATITGGGATGPVGTVTLLCAGTGYSTGVGQATTGGTGNGACTVNISDTLTPIEEYGSYLTHALVYRSVFDGDTGQWSTDDFIASAAIAASITYVDAGSDSETSLADGVDVPAVMEVTNDYLSSARHVAYSDGRVYALGLGYDSETATWKRRTAIAVSNQTVTDRSSYAFATNFDPDYSVITDGLELDGYAQSGSVGRGIIARNDDRFVFLENEFFLLRGDNPVTGWTFTRLDSIGLDSAKTLADCRSALVWLYGESFYTYSGGIAVPISKGLIDCSLIDLTQPHNAVYFDEKYILYCTYNSLDALLIYDLVNQAWRIRYSDGLDLVGIATDGATVYGVKPDGNAVNIFGSTTSDYGAASTLREIWTQYIVAADAGSDAQSRELLLIVESDVSLTLNWVVSCEGTTNQTASGDINITAGQTRYHIPLSIIADAYMTKVSYTGTTPPNRIYFAGPETAETAAIG